MTSPEIIAPSPALLRTVRDELGSHLPEAHRPLLHLLDVSSYLTCITVALGERAVGRIILPMEKLEATTGLLKGLGLHVHRGWLDFMPRVSGVEGTDHDRVAVPRGTPGATQGMLYMGLDADLVEGAEMTERQGHHGLLAQLFGYPDCCSRVFTEPAAPKHLDKTPDSYQDTGPFPREMNPCVPYLYGLHPLFHFPCSPRCTASRELLRQRLGYLRRYAPSCAEYDSLGEGIAFYGQGVGIAVATRYQRTDEDTYLLERVVTRGDRLREVLSRPGASPRLRIHSVHEFELGDARIQDARGLVARFE
ncbi:hypothetical protein HPC49_14940 [Pyxidicoccus fallax]|uniref:Uncharacterized protein n=1 Tax=Pyxidicoccus fallax TaxID=394095 RepID=A0A848L7A1_9BACT|nr:hypothetical protein [Pyxidicoccus fallax]NMO14639.1 hypothetical protein [Pyxidicoccus fallax]NPC79528.1 hypothetical protein [Pyxidicoccus fallax]